MTVDAAALQAGARNLLVSCAGLSAGDHVLIVAEDPALGWYDDNASKALADTAKSLDISAEIVRCGAPRNTKDGDVFAAVEAAQNVVFMARIGDQDRFDAVLPGRTRTMVYARTAPQLASLYGCTPHSSMKRLKWAVDAVMGSGEAITVTCPLGTKLTGTPPAAGPTAPADTAVQRFPMGVPAPTLASAFSGEVVLAHYLTPTGSRVYEPASCVLSAPVVAEVAGGRLINLRGAAEVIDAVRAHYRHVAGLFGIDADAVHSFHAGIHPGVDFAGRIDDDPDHWSNTVFTHPRFLHVHTCGAYAPGEICWMVLDPTVTVGDLMLWDGGRFNFDGLAARDPGLADEPGLKTLFGAPPGRALGDESPVLAVSKARGS